MKSKDKIVVTRPDGTKTRFRRRHTAGELLKSYNRHQLLEDVTVEYSTPKYGSILMLGYDFLHGVKGVRSD